MLARGRNRRRPVLAKADPNPHDLGMLELRPTCENCAIALPPACTDAMICSFECTFCTGCAHGVLGDVCPNCGGGFAPRPVRPARNWKNDNFLGTYPASTAKRERPVDLDSHRELRDRIGTRPPDQR
jgi:uncharacterized protein